MKPTAALTKTIDRAGYASEMSYDAWRQMLTKLSPNGLVASYAYDGEGRRTVESNDLGGGTVYTSYFAYDSAGFLVAQTDPLGNPTSFGHDAQGRTIVREDALGDSTYYAYDPNGNKVVDVGPRWQELSMPAVTTYYAYDVMNRLARLKRLR